MKINFKKELRDWGIIIAIFGILYITGAYTEVAAFTQRMVLVTGIIAPDTSIPDVEKEKADYDFNIITLNNEKFDLKFE